MTLRATEKDGMTSEELDALVEDHSYVHGEWPKGVFYAVVPDAIQGHAGWDGITVFKTRGDAIVYARAMAQGNVDQRVLKVTESTLVLSTVGQK